MEPIPVQLDFQRKKALTEQIREALRGLILSGALSAGQPLPTVREFAKQLRVNFNTVARAYRALDVEGLITTRQGRGTIVAEQDISAGALPISTRLESIFTLLSQEIQRTGITWEMARQEFLRIEQSEATRSIPVRSEPKPSLLARQNKKPVAKRKGASEEKAARSRLAHRHAAASHRKQPHAKVFHVKQSRIGQGKT